MKKIFSVVLIAAILFACNSEEKKAETAATETKTDGGKAPVELINDSSFAASSLAAFAAFENKDIEGYTANMDDNVMFRWSGGDSLAGKAAVKAYYSGRYALIDTIKFSEHISLPVMANASPIPAVPTGKWLLSWYRVDVKYKTGKSITFWAHNTQHFNAAGKIDIFTQYIDRHPINVASK